MKLIHFSVPDTPTSLTKVVRYSKESLQPAAAPKANDKMRQLQQAADRKVVYRENSNETIDKEPELDRRASVVSTIHFKKLIQNMKKKNTY